MPTVMPAAITCSGDLRVPSRVLADLEEGRFQTFVGQRLEHGRRVAAKDRRRRSDDFLVTQEVILLEMLEAEAGAAGGIDLDDPREPHAARLIAQRNGRGCRRGLRLRRRIQCRRLETLGVLVACARRTGATLAGALAIGAVSAPI